jgi:hypothetical protein
MANGGIIGPINDPLVGNTSATTQSFTSSTTFTGQTGQSSINILVVAGGGGGRSGFNCKATGAGGGGGGLILYPAYPISYSQSIPFTIGAGGAIGAAGTDSTFCGTTILTAKGGGKGGSLGECGANSGGGSGGGGGQGPFSPGNPGAFFSGGTASQPTQPGAFRYIMDLVLMVEDLNH